MSYNSADLKKALIIMAEARYQIVPEENDIAYPFSEKFETWAERLIVHKVDTRSKKLTVKRILKITLIAAIIAALLTVTALAIPAVREAIAKYFIKESGSYYEIEFNTLQIEQTTETTSINNDEVRDTPHQEETAVDADLQIEYFAPTFIPNDFSVLSEVKGTTTLIIRYQDSKYNQIRFTQFALPDGESSDASMIISAKDKVQTQKTINGITFDVFTSSTSRTMIWADEYYFYYLKADTIVTEDQMERIITSIGSYE